MTFPSEATVFPVLYQPGQRSSGMRPDNTLVWDEQQNLTRGYISSRTTTQFMVLRERLIERVREIREQRDDSTGKFRRRQPPP